MEIDSDNPDKDSDSDSDAADLSDEDSLGGYLPEDDHVEVIMKEEDRN